ncbi:hypothetical protein AB0M20_05560 [Actinoplanes sp. NPDC051633]|uniref:hypothetical protein n=1 Tax=Actinoplanes sp. NPDC051633 TaxID=3155670 RepID=UPI0034219BD0
MTAPAKDTGAVSAAEAEPEPSSSSGAAAPDRLGALLATVFVGEPPVGDGVDDVYRRADLIRRGRLRRVVAGGAVTALLVAAVGYALTAAVIPGTNHPGVAAPAPGPTPVVDPLLGAVASVIGPRGLRALPREPARGEGWRQYSVVDSRSGRPRGLIEVSAYAAPDGLCFPVRADADACAKPLRGGDDLEYTRYTDDRDADWQVHEAIARRLSDGRVIAVMATGERGTGDAAAGRPPLTAAETAGLAVDVRVSSAFDEGERCNGPDPACPVLKVPVPVGR